MKANQHSLQGKVVLGELPVLLVAWSLLAVKPGVVRGVVVEGTGVLVVVGVLVKRLSPDFHLPVFGPPAQVTDRPAGAGTPGAWAVVASILDAPAKAGMPGALA